MDIPLFNWFQNLWNDWDLRICVLLSLLLQALLIFLAPLRKRKSQKLLTGLIWSAYLIADSVAVFSLGLISQSQGEVHEGSPSKTSFANMNRNLLALWAPFLLLHLGGPDTITAFALEDNELWLRHLANLLLQLFVAGYIFFQSFPDNKLWLPTCFMFLAGLIKYAERNRALYLASLKCFRDSMLTKPDPGPNYAKLMDEYSWMLESGLPTKIEMTKEPETGIERNVIMEEGANSSDPNGILMVKKAYDFFNTFKGLIVDLIFSFHEKEKSRKFFLKIKNAEKAFRVIEIQLSFIYDVLYTKASVIHSRQGYLFRITGFACTLVAFFLFTFSKKKEMHEIDISVTYALFTGAISLDIVALLMLIFSDWTVALLKSSNSAMSFVSKILTMDIFLNKIRWSGSVSKFNLMNYCLCKRPKWVDNMVDYMGSKDLLDEIQYTSYEPLDVELKELIFEELKRKSETAVDLNTSKQICSSRGHWVLRHNSDELKDKLGWSFAVEYDESLLLWHIATDILYHKEDNSPLKNRNFCKVLSDYMLYLLVTQPTIIASIASIAQIRYNDTCAEAEKFFGKLEPESNTLKALLQKCTGGFKLEAEGNQLKQECQRLLDVNTKVKPADVKGDRSKSVLFDAVRLAKNLQELEVDKWKLMSEVWVELLCYAASHCRATIHAQQVSRGGELVTLIWLLMVQFGLGEQFRIESGHARAK